MSAVFAPVQLVIPPGRGNLERYGFAQRPSIPGLPTASHSCTTVLMPDQTAVAKDPLAVEFGRRGGKSRLTKMTAEQRRESARRAAQARWGKKAAAPDPNNPNDPQGPGRDHQRAEAGIMLSSRRRPATRVSSDHLGGGSRAAAA